ncbi:MAG: V-type ATP synthase subunit D [Bacteroidales bacterium]|nr:V-type ATP synthase subunit D [Bacteroidales bacterium]
MTIKFQYNKISLQQLEKQLNIRLRALPTIKNKESALRVEVRKAKDEYLRIDDLLRQKLAAYEKVVSLWGEFDFSLVVVRNVELGSRKIAGVKIPVLNNVLFELKSFSVFNNPKWYLDGIALIKELITIAIEKEVFDRTTRLLEQARKKTTQKVNLFEKIQIPGYNNAIRKVKRFMEDEDNLSKSAQKIVKNRQLKMEETV